MRSLYEAIIDSDEQIDQKAEDVLTIQHIAEKLIKIFGKRLDTFNKLWNGYIITFRDFPVHIARYDFSMKNNLVVGTNDNAPLKDIYDKYNPLIDRFKRELSHIKNIAKVSDREELEDAPAKTNMRKSIRTLHIEFDKEPCYNKLDIEFITCFATMNGKPELKNPSNLFVEMYARVYYHEAEATEQFSKIINRLKQ